MDDMGTRNLIITVLAVIVAVAIAWFIVDVVFHLLFFAVKLLVVAVVAVIVFFALRGLFARGSD
jgi:hypothetical protein